MRAKIMSQPTVWVDLVLVGGGLVRIACPEKYEDELYESLNNSLERGDSWSPDGFEGCQATYLGHVLTSVYMGRVMGRL